MSSLRRTAFEPLRPQEAPEPPLVRWTGTSRRQYHFQLWPIGTQFFAVAGVYIFCSPLSDDRWRGLYVGQTESFKDRLTDGLRQHHRLPAILQNGASHICVLPAPGGLALRCAIETDLRRILDPVCNRQ